MGVIVQVQGIGNGPGNEWWYFEWGLNIKAAVDILLFWDIYLALLLNELMKSPDLPLGIKQVYSCVLLVLLIQQLFLEL